MTPVAITHHLDEATLVAYAAGSLGEALSVVAAGHLAWCPKCRAAMRRAEAVGGTLIETLEAAPLSPDAITRAMAALDDAPTAVEVPPAPAVDGGMPSCIARRIGGSLEHLHWRRVAPRVQVHDLPLSPGAHGRLCLIRIAKGGRIPDHGHTGPEMTLVIQGSYVDRLGRFSTGDVADLDPEVEHELSVDSDEPCICLVGFETPAHFKGLIARMIQPLTGF